LRFCPGVRFESGHPDQFSTGGERTEADIGRTQAANSALSGQIEEKGSVEGRTEPGHSRTPPGHALGQTRAKQQPNGIRETPEDLRRVVEAWAFLSEAAKSEILGVVKEAEGLMKNQSSA